MNLGGFNGKKYVLLESSSNFPQVITVLLPTTQYSKEREDEKRIDF